VAFLFCGVQWVRWHEVKKFRNANQKKKRKEENICRISLSLNSLKRNQKFNKIKGLEFMKGERREGRMIA